MNNLKGRRGDASVFAAARGLFWVLSAVITALALYPRLTLPEPEITVGTTAYYNHVIAFTTLIVVGAVGWTLQHRLIAGVAIGAIALELAQTFSPGRETSLLDLLASLGGVAVGSAIVQVAQMAIRQTKIRRAPVASTVRDS